ncbi:MAG: DUF4426 domain-containing protein [Stenotrophobium sp.]
MMQKFLAPFLLTILCLPGLVRADQAVRSGGYIVRYAALSSTSLTPEIARAYGIQRRANHALLIINTQRETTLGKTVAVTATASGSAADLMGNLQPLQLHASPQAGSGDLFAEFDTVNGEFLHFDLGVTPQGAAAPIAVKFQQQFYNDTDD